MNKTYTDYILLTATCNNKCGCGGSVATLRIYDGDGGYFLYCGTGCAGTQMEITEEISQSLIDQYAALTGLRPQAYQGCE